MSVQCNLQSDPINSIIPLLTPVVTSLNVTIDGVWIGNLMYCMLLQLLTTGNCDSLMVLHTPKVTITIAHIKSLLSLHQPLLCSSFQQWTFPFLWVPELALSVISCCIDLLVNSVYIISISEWGGDLLNHLMFSWRVDVVDEWSVKYVFGVTDQHADIVSAPLPSSTHIRPCLYASFGLIRYMLLHKSVLKHLV
jgi:hypothetical protein